MTRRNGDKERLTGSDRFRTLFENSADAQFLSEGDVFVDCNNAALKMMGCSQKADILGHHPHEFSPNTQPDGQASLDKAREMLALALAKGSHRFECVHRRADGTEFPAEISLTVLTLNGKLLVHEAVRDVTDRDRSQRALRASGQRYRSLCQSVGDGFAAADMGGRFIEANPAYLDMLGYSFEELLNLTHKEVTPKKWHAMEDAAVEQTLKRGYSDFYQKEYVRKDGQIIPVDQRMNVFRDEDGKPTEMWAFVRVITELKQAEQALTSARDRAQTYLDVAGVMLVVIEADQTVSLVNMKGCEVLECEEDEIIGRKWFNTFVPERDRERVEGAFVRLMAGEIEPVEHFENAVLTMSGQEKIIAWHNTVLRDQTGKIIRSLSSGEDITERKQAEQALKDSEARFRQLFDGVDTGITVRDAETFKLLDANRAFCEMYGYTGQDLSRLPLGNLGAGESVEERRRCLIDHYRQVVKGGPRTFQLEATKKDGSVFWAEMNVQRLALGDKDYLLTVSRDVTQLRKAQNALKRSEEAALLLAQETGIISEIGHVISSSLDIEEVYELFADEVRKLIPFDLILVNLVNQQEGTMTTAYTSGMEVAGRRKGIVVPIAGSVTEQLIRTRAPMLLQPGSIEEVQNRFPGLVPSFQAGLRSRLSVRLIARGEVIGSLTVWSKQEKAYGERDIRLAQSVAGQIAGAIANARLFRECKRVEEALRESEESYRSLVETSPDAIFLHEEGRIVYLNPAAVRLFGAGSAEDLCGRNALDFIHPDDREEIKNRRHFIMTRGMLAPLKEIRIVRRDGSTVNVEATAGVSYYRGKKVIQVTQRDITERKRAEERIRTSLKEKEVLLKEIHHRVKNNLQIVSSLLYLQATRTEHPGAVSALHESRNRVKSMALIHERLYQSPNLASVDMGEYTRNLVSDLQHSYRIEGSAVRLRLDIEEIPLGITEAIPCGLIINELVSNALKHAFPMGTEGEITIRLQRADGKETTLTVSDNGIGLPEQMDFRKSPSLGLTLINSLVEQLGGTVELDRKGGTAFTITFG
jgi:PAS domain S-box-containing protein